MSRTKYLFYYEGKAERSNRLALGEKGGVVEEKFGEHVGLQPVVFFPNPQRSCRGERQVPQQVGGDGTSHQH